ncbi:hypothetical protein RFI_05923 [Reticulomyxa filosa]|uniref:PH domain-containing protein n=1 Tax=Reticulomyxa filosa TaxID=46433 RepID=X6P0X7_RETFI|nr:hypothetical protein RFI_05923 [Reticulomyxa filosa]|eukprot:ETO31197.1 hypothetical protein RFI_05923 [Reticulomyxa filosa]
MDCTQRYKWTSQSSILAGEIRKEDRSLEDQLETLQSMLQYIPSVKEEEKNGKTILRSGSKKKDVSTDMSQYIGEPLCSGFLIIQEGSGHDPLRYYCELMNCNQLLLRKQPNGKIKQVIHISFIQSNLVDDKLKAHVSAIHEDAEVEDTSDVKHNLADQEQHKQDDNDDSAPAKPSTNDLFLAHLESQEAHHTFKLFSPSGFCCLVVGKGIYIVSAATEKDKERFSTLIERYVHIVPLHFAHIPKHAFFFFARACIHHCMSSLFLLYI